MPQSRRERLTMLAYRATYEGGRFVPQSFGKLPEGTQVIITLLDEPPRETAQRIREFDAIMQAIDAAQDEEMPPLERVRLRETVL